MKNTNEPDDTEMDFDISDDFVSRINKGSLSIHHHDLFFDLKNKRNQVFLTPGNEVYENMTDVRGFPPQKDFPDKLSYFFMYLGFDFQFYK